MDFEELKVRYRGDRVAIYDDIRAPMSLWSNEQAAMRRILGDLKPGLSVVDLPVGTGRYAEFYKELGLQPIGVDISLDMLTRTAAKVGELGLGFPLVRSDIRSTPFPDQSVDVVVCTRFMNWIQADGVHACLAELKRISKNLVIFSLRSYRPARELSLAQKLYKLKYRFFRFRTRARHLVHEPNVAVEVLDQQDFKLRAKHVVETPAHGAVEYAFYVMERQA